jgi:hypothetical protein
MAAVASLQRAVSRIRTSADVESVRAALVDASRCLQTTSSASEKLAAHHARFLDVLLTDVLRDWTPCMSTQQRRQCFDVWFDGVFLPPHHVLLALGRALCPASVDPQTVVQLVRQLLWRPCAEKRSVGLLPILQLVRADMAAAEAVAVSGTAAAAVPAPVCRAETVVTVLISLPERVANALRDMRVPQWALPTPFQQTLTAAMWELFLQHEMPCSLRLLRLLVERLSTRLHHHADGVLMREWTPHLLASIAPKPNPKIIGAMALFLGSMSGAAYEAMIRSLLASLPDFSPTGNAAHLLRRLLSGNVSSGSFQRYVLVQKLPLDPALQRTPHGFQSLRYIVDCLVSIDSARGDSINGQQGLVYEAFTAVLAVWAEVGFIARSTAGYHRYLTCALLLCMDGMDTECAQNGAGEGGLGAQPWVAEMMHGVQQRFDCPVGTVRVFGMLVAERLSDFISPNQPLRFDETCAMRQRCSGASQACLDRSASSESVRSGYFELLSAFEGTGTEAAARKLRGVNGGDTTALHELQTDDPDSLLAPAYDDDSDSSSASSSAGSSIGDTVSTLEPYVMEAGTSLATRQRPPRHVREMIAWLRLPKEPTTGDYDRYTAALTHAEELLVAEDTAVEVVYDEALEIITTLVHLQDSLISDDDRASPSFDELRHSSMVAAAKLAPAPICQFLAQTAFATNLSVSTRIECLAVLEDAGRALSTPGHGQSHQKISGRQHEKSAGASRRWGHTARTHAMRTTHSVRPAKPNGFAPHAEFVFFTLLAGVTSEDGPVSYLQEQPLFIAKLIHCLGVILESVKLSPGGARIAEHLAELCWNLRMHSDASVRRAVLFAFSVAMFASPDRVERLEWLHYVSTEDPDELCRQLAAAISKCNR